nr:MAG TPA: hypothetical protein [Caudoviricetes sp.]
MRPSMSGCGLLIATTPTTPGMSIPAATSTTTTLTMRCGAAPTVSLWLHGLPIGQIRRKK